MNFAPVVYMMFIGSIKMAIFAVFISSKMIALSYRSSTPKKSLKQVKENHELLDDLIV